MKKHAAWPVMVLALVFATGCSDSTEPEPGPAVVMELESVLDDSGPETVTRSEVVVKNVADRPVHYPLGCGYEVRLVVEDSTGVALVMRDPSLVLVCPPLMLEFSPGEVLWDQMMLAVAWDESGSSYDIPPGDYTVRACFRYYRPPADQPIDLEQEIGVHLD